MAATHDKNRSIVIISVAQLDRLRAMMLALPVPSMAKKVPWGYRVSAKNPKMLEPIDEHFKYLYEAIHKHLKDCSYKEVATWLSAKTGVPISDEGLTRIHTRRPPDKRVLLPLKERMKYDTRPK